MEQFHCSLETSLNVGWLVLTGLTTCPYPWAWPPFRSTWWFWILCRRGPVWGPSWILMSYLQQCSRTGSNLLCKVFCCLLLITSLRLLIRLLVLWLRGTLFLFARTLLSNLYHSSAKVPSSSWFVLASSLPCRWVPGPMLTAAPPGRYFPRQARPTASSSPPWWWCSVEAPLAVLCTG